MESFRAEGVAQHDYTYVPGFSDQRVARDLAIARLHRNEIRASEVPTLDQNLRWYRCATKDGDPDNRRVVAARNEGYRAVTKDDVGKSWMTELPPGGHVAPDGTIKISGGDLQLFIADKQSAAKNAMRKKMMTEDLVQGMEFQQGGIGDVGSKVKGASPTVVKEFGS